jgi:pimeloyl-ACP methyl ester carboxylesterase
MPAFLTQPLRRLPVTPADLVAVAALLTGLIATAVAAAYVTRSGYYGAMRDSCTALWPALLLLLFGAQLPLRARRVIPTGAACCAGAACPSRTLRVFHLVGALCSAASSVGYAVGGQAPEAVLYAMLILVHAAIGKVVAELTAGAAAAVAADDEDEGEDGDAMLNQTLYIDTDAGAAGAAAGAATPSTAGKALGWANAAVVLPCAMLATLFCTAGAATYAEQVAYPLLGHFAEVDGYRLHYACMGPPAAANASTVILNADVSHGVGDFWPLMRSFSAAGRRVCAFDKPGFGRSDCFRTDADVLDLSPALYDGLLAAVAAPPYLLFAWAGGGDMQFRYAARHPANVAGLAFFNVYFRTVEWRAYQAYKGLSAAATDAYRRAQIQQRFATFGLIRAVAVPWGFVSLFTEKAGDYAWPARFAAARYPYSRGKTWVTQYHTMRQLNRWMDAEGSTALGPLHGAAAAHPAVAAKPLLNIANNRSRAVLCKARFYADDAARCQQQVDSEAFMLRDAVAVARNVSGSNSAVWVCSDADCNLGMVRSNPDAIVNRTLAWAASHGI